MQLSDLLNSGNPQLQAYLDDSKELYDYLDVTLLSATVDDSLKSFIFEFTPASRNQSYKDVIHGGIVMTYLDSVCGVLALAYATSNRKKIVFSKHFECDFKDKMVPGILYRAYAEITYTERNVIITKGRILDFSNGEDNAKLIIDCKLELKIK